MADGKTGVCCWNEATNLGHHSQQGYASDVRAFARHVAPRYNLETRGMLCGVKIIGNKFVIVNSLAYGMAAFLHSQSGLNLGAGIVVVCCHDLGKRREHVEQGDSFADAKQRSYVF